MSSKVLSYSFSKQSDPQNDLDMRPQVMIVIQKFLDIFPQKVLILIKNITHANNFFRLNNSREEELAVGMKEVSAQATTIATKTATTKTMTKTT